MKKTLLAISAIAILAISMYYANDYGVSKTELTQLEANEEVFATAETERIEMATVDSTNVVAAIDNAALREHQLEVLQQQVADYEEALATARITACNLSPDTITSMQQFAKPNNDGKRLEPSAGVSIALTTYQPGITSDWFACRDGKAVLRKWGPVLGHGMSQHRHATLDPVAPETASST